jgi:surface antigen
MKNFITQSLSVFLIFLLASCATKQKTGLAVGATAGSLFGAILGEKSGNAFFGATIGGIVGGLAGNAIGQKLDETDKKLLSEATEKALEQTKSGNKIKWNNPDSGNEGYVKPLRTYEVDNKYCREFLQEAIIGGKKAKIYGKACRKADGQWEIVSSKNE